MCSSIPSSYLFQVRVSTTDPDVTSVGIEVTLVNETTPPSKGGKRRVTVVKTGDLFSYVFVVIVGYDGIREQPIPISVAAVTVQELKPSSSQTF